MAKIISGQKEFTVDKSEPGRVYNRYRIGNVVRGDLLLDRFELGFLLLHAKSVFTDTSPQDRLSLLASELSEDRDTDLLIVYSRLKSKGLVAKIESNTIKFRSKDSRHWAGSLTVLNENEFFNMAVIRRGEDTFAVVDSDGDFTLYSAKNVNPAGASYLQGTLQRRTGKFRLALAEDESSGIAKRVGSGISMAPEEFDGAGKIGENKMMSLKSRGFRDLISRSLLVRTGFKYGADFRLYERSIEGHAEHLLLVSEPNSLRWYDISRAARIASSVHKNFMIASEVDGEIIYFSVSRIKDVGH